MKERQVNRPPASSDREAVASSLTDRVQLKPLDGGILRGVQVTLEVRLGELSISVDELLQLKQGAVLTLESSINDLADVYLNGAPVARGEIVSVDGRYALRIVELA